MKTEYYNPNPFKIVVTSKNGKKTIIYGYRRAVIEDVIKIEPDSLRVIRQIQTSSTKQIRKAHPVKVQPTQVQPDKIRPKKIQSKKVQPKVQANVTRSAPVKLLNRKTISRKGSYVSAKAKHKNLNGRIGIKIASGSSAQRNYKIAIQSDVIPISTDVAIGVLSYNRLSCVQRLLNSIRQFTDLSKVTLFISDESTDSSVKNYLREQAKDFVFIDNDKNLGIAGNSNRLLKCMSRFKYCFMLNDDVEILKSGWENCYINASKTTGIQHFCYRQPGLMGATLGSQIDKNGCIVNHITEKPHGAMMFYTNDAFNRVGYFDETWGKYGMEHVDWSNRVGLSGIQESGFFDVANGSNYFMIHNEHSSSSKENLGKARNSYEEVRNNRSRIHVPHSNNIILPSISYVIPFRNIGRNESIDSVVNNIRGQRFPVIDIVVVEEDSSSNVSFNTRTINHNFVRSIKDHQFNKSRAFNTGVNIAKHEAIILHDADILVNCWYTKRMYELLQSYSAAHIGLNVMYLTEEYSNQVNRDKSINQNGTCNYQVGYFEGGSLGCKKSVFKHVGGFNEEFVGYGVEDIEFFSRLRACNLYNERTEMFYHLYHGKVAGWQQCHERNKSIMARIDQTNREDYLRTLKNTYNANYGA